MRFFLKDSDREEARRTFLEWLCSIGCLAHAKAIAALSDRQFDSLCLMAMERYEGIVIPDPE